MGMGQFACGVGPCGLDPVYIPPKVLPPMVRRSVYFDPAIKGYRLTDDNGNPVDMHPVDQIVATRCTTEAGQSQSVPTLGQRLRRLFNAAAPSRHPAIATQEVARVLSDLVQAKDIALVSVTVQTDPATKSKAVIVTYQNLHLVQARNRGITASPPILLR